MPAMIRYNKAAIKIFNDLMGNKKKKNKSNQDYKRIVPPSEDNMLKYNLFNQYKKDIG